MSSVAINYFSHSDLLTPPVWYSNHYCCPYCQLEWQDEWDCECNDKCPTCTKEIEPYESILIES